VSQLISGKDLEASLKELTLMSERLQRAEAKWLEELS
jgi:hypothetical protein